jgi:hypothetical protein
MMNKYTLEGLFKNGLLALVVICLLSVNLTACTPVDLANTVNNSVSVLQSPTASTWIIYGADPIGREWIATVQQLGGGASLSAGILRDYKSTVTLTEGLVKSGWQVVSFGKLPEVVQLLVLAKIEAAIPLVEMMSARSLPMISVLGMPGIVVDEYFREDCEYSQSGYQCDL